MKKMHFFRRLSLIICVLFLFVFMPSKAEAADTKLNTPSSVKTTLTDASYVKVSWKKVTSATGYYVYRSTAKSGTYKKVATVQGTSYIDKNVSNGRSYYYKIRAYKKGNTTVKSSYSEIAAYHMRPSKPVITTTYTSGKVKISWKKVTGATTYHVYRMNSNGEYVKIGKTENLSYTDSDVKANKRYKYKVAASYTKYGVTTFSYRSTMESIYTAKIDPDKKMVALTFDDGPGVYTQSIVNCLKENNARATFFVVGNRITTYQSAMKSAYNNGCEIGNHTYSHPTLTYLSISNINSQINKTDNLIEDVTGEKAALVRAPGGATNSTVRSTINKPFIYWSIDTRDWETRSKTATINAVMNNVKDGDIILMHDIHEPTKEAALVLIPKLIKAGYQLVTVSELAEYRGYTMKNGTTYYSFR